MTSEIEWIDATRWCRLPKEGDTVEIKLELGGEVLEGRVCSHDYVETERGKYCPVFKVGTFDMSARCFSAWRATSDNKAMQRPKVEVTDEMVERAARAGHEAYETAALAEGWETNKSCRVDFDSLPDANKRTMLVAYKAALQAALNGER